MGDILYGCDGPCETAFPRSDITVTKTGQWLCNDCFDELSEEDRKDNTGRPPKVKLENDNTTGPDQSGS